MSSIGERMKTNYELPYLYQLMPMIIRIDGKSFHTLSRRLKWKKPFDDLVIQNMQEMTKEMSKEIMNTKLAYLQSDEISFLVINYSTLETQSWFNNEIQKIASVSAGLASSKFSLRFGTEAVFDSRVFLLPPSEVNNYFIWRQQDATRNSIQGLAQANFPAKRLFGLNNSQLQELLWSEKRINWSKLPIIYKRGSCVLKEEDEWKIDNKIPDFIEDRKYVNRFVPEMRQ